MILRKQQFLMSTLTLCLHLKTAPACNFCVDLYNLMTHLLHRIHTKNCFEELSTLQNDKACDPDNL